MALPDGNLANADAATLLRLGDRLAAAGDARGAAAMYQRAARQDPGNPDILIKLGDVSWRAGALQQAVAYYDRALALAPEHRDALSRRARSYLIQNEPEEA
ncbi:MAG: tetratricopeptide repeat protein, partial [Alphaproteobacteria bacterium]